MRAAVAVTDDAWAAYLRDRPNLGEANFWLPSGMRFGAVAVGEPVLFKTHWPDNRIVGGGYLSGWTALKVSEAWRIFGEENGVPSEAALLSRIRHYQRSRKAPRTADPEIGCMMLRDLFFAAPGDEVAGPPDFGKPIVTWKRYDLEAESGQYVADAFASLRLGRADVSFGKVIELDAPHSVGPTRSEPRYVKTTHRIGQNAFKATILTNYRRRCAISLSRLEPVLQAAHIRPVARGGLHSPDNGLLLRADVHKLFDDGYLGIDAERRLLVSDRLRDDYGNGEEFYARASSVIELPDRRSDWPRPEWLEWHRDTVFQP